MIVDTLRDSWSMCKAASKFLGTKTVWRLGIASSVLGALTATTVFATLQTDPSAWARAAVAAAVMLSAGLAAAQTWYVSQRDGLRTSRDQLHALHQSIERKVFDFRFNGAAFEDAYDTAVAAQYSEIDTDSIPTDQNRWERARKEANESMKAELGLD